MFISLLNRKLIGFATLAAFSMTAACASGSAVQTTVLRTTAGHGPATTSKFIPVTGDEPPFVDATAPDLLSGTVHELDIPVEEKDIALVPGVVQHLWTFNGTVPAPFLRVHVGDTVKIHFENLAINKMPHSLDFQLNEVAGNDKLLTINPGKSMDIEWQANAAGVFMYHCVTSPAVYHVSSGMFGMIIVEPKEGLAKVDREFVLVQNEWYFGAPGQIIDLNKAMADTPAPDYMAFNGVPNQYIDHPLHGNKGERLRFFVLNVGPNLKSSFNIVGMALNTLGKEGLSGLITNLSSGSSPVIELAPAQGTIIETVAPENGLYEFGPRTANDPGAHGLIQIGEGATN